MLSKNQNVLIMYNLRPPIPSSTTISFQIKRYTIFSKCCIQMIFTLLISLYSTYFYFLWKGQIIIISYIQNSLIDVIFGPTNNIWRIDLNLYDSVCFVLKEYFCSITTELKQCFKNLIFNWELKINWMLYYLTRTHY